MSAINAVARLDNVKQVVQMAEHRFNTLARIHNAVNFEREASFAMQILKSNDFLASKAMADQDSLITAIVNVAAIGLTLSPVSKLAYLIPRDGKVCLDISYRGYLQLAYDVGAIRFANAEIVYSGDDFEIRGLGEEPKHIRRPFALDRGEIVGAYCVAITHANDYITTVMNIDEIGAIRDRSESWKAHKAKGVKTPWLTDESEMIKKTVIRRAYKTWPMTNTRERFEKAIEVGNDFEGALEMPALASVAPQVDSARSDALFRMRAMLQVLDETEHAFAEHSSRVCKRTLKTIEDMTDKEITAANTMLSTMIDKRNAEGKS